MNFACAVGETDNCRNATLKVNLKPDTYVTLLTHLVLHTSKNCLVWSNMGCTEMLQDLTMVHTVLPDFNMSSIIAFVGVFETVLDTLDSSAYLNIHMKVEHHEQRRILWHNPRIIDTVRAKLCPVSPMLSVL